MNRLDWDVSAQKLWGFLLGIILLIGLLFATTWADGEVFFRDPNLEAVIRKKVDKPTKAIFQSDLNKITHLDASGVGIKYLYGIENLNNLVVLDLSENQVQDVSPLKRLYHLSELDLSRNGITDLNDVRFDLLANLPIKVLNLEENQITSIESLHTLFNLRQLNLRINSITDISPLRNLNILVELNLRGNNVHDLAPLSSLYELEYLNIHSNSDVISALPLTDLVRLKTLIMENVPLQDDVSILANMEHLAYLNISNSQISDISSLRNLTKLRELNLRSNDISDLSPLSGHTKLVYLNLHSNPNIQSVLPLKNSTNLKTLIIANVYLGEEIHVLSEMAKLQYLNARNCGIADLRVLGKIMEIGALQDNEERGIRAFIDIRDNPISFETEDTYASIRPYWGNIDSRVPFKLPNYYTLPPPTFSRHGGYYNQPFSLVLEKQDEGAQIYYTLDGSEPTPDDFLYDSPILIKSLKGESAVLSSVSEVSPRWVPPEGDIFKATVVRARVFDANGGKSSLTITHTFMVDEEKRYTLPVFSLSINPDDFFDYDYGIYVMGRAFDELYTPNPDLNPAERIANYKFYGEEWERPIHIEFFEKNGELGFSQAASVRIHGTSTRERSQKSLRIYAQDPDGLSEVISYDLFPGLINPLSGEPVNNFKTFVLRNGGSDWKSALFRDALMQSLIPKDLLINTQAERPVIVLLNGEYWGLYNLRERADEYYLAEYYGIDSDSIVLLSNNGELNAGSTGDEQSYLDMLAFIKENDMTNANIYSHVHSMIDVENYIDYQVAEIYFNNTNWPHANIKFWKKKVDQYAPAAPYGHDGRWRWVIYDTDFGFGLDGGELAVEHDNLLNATQPEAHEWAGELLSSLLKNPEFQLAFINRFADQLNTTFVSERVTSQIDQMVTIREPEIKETLLRWRGSNASVEEWYETIDVLHQFAKYRPDYVRQHIADYLGLGGVSNVSLFTDSDMGYITINSISISTGTPGVEDPESWSGIYFQDIPITITAIPLSGYRFVRWEGAQGMDANVDTITMTLTEDVSLRAVFELIE